MELYRSSFFPFDVYMFMFCSYADAQESMVYSYKKSFDAFAAKLSSNEAKKLESMCVTVSVWIQIVMINSSD